MKIYIAAPYAVRNELRHYASDLRAMGHEVTSSWLDATHQITPGTLETAPDLSDQYALEHSLTDIREVQDSDLVILVTWGTALAISESGGQLGGNSGGRHIEVGVALAKGIPVLVWGDPENIFHRGMCYKAQVWVDIRRRIGRNTAVFA